MDKVLIKKLNELLNSKNVRCLNCNEFVYFSDSEVEANCVIVNFNSFKCNCMIEKDSIDDVAYATSKYGERVNLSSYLKLDAKIYDEINSIDDIYSKLDDIDSNLQDRSKASQDKQSSLDLNTEDIINNFDNLLKTVFEKELGLSVENAIRRIVACEELSADKVEGLLLDNYCGDFDGSEEWQLHHAEVKSLNGYSLNAYYNKSEGLMAFNVFHYNYLYDTTFFDLRKMCRFNDTNNSSVEGIIQTLALTLIGTNLIRRVAGIPEVVYTAPKFEFKRLADTVCKQLTSKDLSLFGKDESVSDWTKDSISSKEFSFINSKGSKLNFKIEDETENFILLDLEAITVGSRFNGSRSSCLVDKSSCKVFDDEPSNIVHTLDFIATALAAKEHFNLLSDSYGYKMLNSNISELEDDIDNAFNDLYLYFTEKEVDELRTMKCFNGSAQIHPIKEELLDKEGYKELNEIITIHEGGGFIYSLDGFGDYYDDWNKELKTLEKDVADRLKELTNKYTVVGVMEMIENNYSEDDADYIIESFSYIDEDFADEDIDCSECVESEIEDTIEEFEALVRNSVKHEDFLMHDVVRRIVSCKELEWDYFEENLLDKNWFESDDWHTIIMDEVCLLDCAPNVYINIEKELLMIKLDYIDYNGRLAVYSSAFDISKLCRFLSPHQSIDDMKAEKIAITLLITNLIRRVHDVPEIEYTEPSFNINDLAVQVRNQVLSGDIVIFGQDVNISDWCISNVKTNEFTLENSNGSKMNFNIKEESENFAILRTEAFTEGTDFNSALSSHVIDKLSGKIFGSNSNYIIDDNAIHLFFHLTTAKKAIKIFNRISFAYELELDDAILDLRVELQEVLEILRSYFSMEEIEEIENFDCFKSIEGTASMKENFYYLEEDYLDLSDLVDFTQAMNMFFSLEEFSNFFDDFKGHFDMIVNEKEDRLNLLLERYSPSEIISMIKKSYSKEAAEYLIDILELNEVLNNTL